MIIQITHFALVWKQSVIFQEKSNFKLYNGLHFEVHWYLKTHIGGESAAQVIVIPRFPFRIEPAIFAFPRQCMERNWGSHYWNASLCATDQLMTTTSL